MTKKTTRSTQAKRFTVQNRKCGESVRLVLQEAKRVACERAGTPYDPLRSRDSYGAGIVELLVNIRHFCDMKALNFGVLDADAYQRYSAEVVQARTGIRT